MDDRHGGNPYLIDILTRLDRLEACVLALVKREEGKMNVSRGFAATDHYSCIPGPWDELRKEKEDV